MKVGRVAIVKEREKSRWANLCERKEEAAVTVAVHVHARVRLRALERRSNHGAMRKGKDRLSG